jgi:hypothetical protein
MKKKERGTEIRMTKEAIATIWKVLTGPGKAQGSSVDDACPSSGARVTLSRPSIREVAVTTVGGWALGQNELARRFGLRASVQAHFRQKICDLYSIRMKIDTVTECVGFHKTASFLLAAATY